MGFEVLGGEIRVLSLYIAFAPLPITRIILKLRVISSGTVLDLRTTTLQNCEAVPRRARIEG